MHCTNARMIMHCNLQPCPQYAGMEFQTVHKEIGGESLFAVQKLHKDEWTDWVYIGTSTIPEADLGIFAARAFKKHEYVGRYVGRIVGPREIVTDKVLEVSLHSFGYIMTTRKLQDQLQTPETHCSRHVWLLHLAGQAKDLQGQHHFTPC